MSLSISSAITIVYDKKLIVFFVLFINILAVTRMSFTIAPSDFLEENYEDFVKRLNKFLKKTVFEYVITDCLDIHESKPEGNMKHGYHDCIVTIHNKKTGTIFNVYCTHRYIPTSHIITDKKISSIFKEHLDNPKLKKAFSYIIQHYVTYAQDTLMLEGIETRVTPCRVLLVKYENFISPIAQKKTDIVSCYSFTLNKEGEIQIDEILEPLTPDPVPEPPISADDEEIGPDV